MKMENKNFKFGSSFAILAVLSFLFVNVAFSSPLLTGTESDLRLNTDKIKICGVRFAQAVVHTCKYLTISAPAPELINNNDLSEDSDSEYYDSSDESSANESREKRSIGLSIVPRCCTIGCSRNDLLKFCTTEFYSASPSTTTTTTTASSTTLVTESESQESNESTVEVEEEETPQTELAITRITSTPTDDLVIFPNEQGQLGNIISGSFLNRYSYHTTT